jgi:hypothetical protein
MFSRKANDPIIPLFSISIDFLFPGLPSSQPLLPPGPAQGHAMAQSLKDKMI